MDDSCWLGHGNAKPNGSEEDGYCVYGTEVYKKMG